MKLPFLALFLIVLAPFAQARTPVVLATDIGTDIDDSWAVAQILRTPALDLKLVLVETGDTHYRASLAAKLLERAGAKGIPVAIGDNGKMAERDMNMAVWTRDYDLQKYPGGVRPDGAAAVVDTISHLEGNVTVISIGASPTLARAMQAHPELARRCRFVGMYGSFDVGYGGSAKPSAESNVVVNPAALRTLLAAPWQDILLTPLDTCGLVSLSGADYHAIWCATADPLLNAVIENYCTFAPHVWWMKCDFFTQHSTTLFDCVAVYLAESEDLVNVKTLTFDVTDDGFTRENAHGAFKARVAMSWKDQAAFEHRLAKTLLKDR